MECKDWEECRALGFENLENKDNHALSFCLDIFEVASGPARERKYGTRSRPCFSARAENFSKEERS